ncbi:hypothetical protein [Pseudomonas oryzihabitans]|uniref:hypothetical protein n=1 Tax=Pseudomonas oryzihabitans TaxID=47885 RepID=UPI0021C3CB32|nr:hypothetical protein [Pseudomonas oryzihabitans]
MRRVPRLGWRQGLALGVAVLAAGFAYPACRHFHPVSAAEGWRYRNSPPTSPWSAPWPLMPMAACS